MPELYIERELKARCDRCGAKAKVRVLLQTEGVLDFCGHHYRQHRDELGNRRARIIMRAAD